MSTQKYYEEHREECKARSKAHYEANKERYAQQSHERYLTHKEEAKEAATKSRKKRRAENKEYVLRYKMTHPCAICGESDPLVLEFHHRDPETKDRYVNTRLGRNRRGVSEICKAPGSIEHLQAEIDKCDVLCSNCHRKIEANKVLTRRSASATL